MDTFVQAAELTDHAPRSILFEECHATLGSSFARVETLPWKRIDSRSLSIHDAPIGAVHGDT